MTARGRGDRLAPTLVLLPGLDGTGELLRGIVQVLGSDCAARVVAYPPDEPLGYAALTALARRALPSDGRYVLLGESFSGPIAVCLAAAKPPGLVGLILCSSFVRSPQPALGALRFLLPILPVKHMPAPLLNFVSLGRQGTPALRAALSAALGQVSARCLRARLRAVLRVDVTRELEAVAVPVLYLRATEDRLVPARAAAQIVDTRPTARVVAIEAPHLLLQVAPKAAAAAIRTFMQGLAAL